MNSYNIERCKKIYKARGQCYATKSPCALCNQDLRDICLGKASYHDTNGSITLKRLQYVRNALMLSDDYSIIFDEEL